MDNKRLWVPMLIAVSAAMVYLLVILPYLYEKYPDLRPDAAAARPTAPAATQPQAGPGSTAAPSTGVATTGTAGAPSTAPSGDVLRAVPGDGTPVLLGSESKNDPQFALGVRVVPTGAGLAQVVLNDYTIEANSDARYAFQLPYVGFEDRTRALATRWVNVDGQQLDVAGVPWALASSDADSAVYTLDVAGARGPVVRLRKEYQLTPRGPDQARGFELAVNQTIRNLTDRPVLVSTGYNGPLTPPRELLSGPDQMTIGGYTDGQYVTAANHYTDTFTAENATRDLTVHEGRRAAWVGQASSYFDAIFRPEPAPGAAGWAAEYVDKIVGEGLDQHPDVKDRKVAITVSTKPTVVPAGGEVALPGRAFFLPKVRELFNTPYLTAPPLAFNTALYFNTGPCGFCAWDWLIDGLVWLLWLFHQVTFDWGLAIIVLVVLVRVILHPVTKASQVQMYKTQKLAPQMERIKKKYADDKQAQQREMMKLQAETAPAMILGCLPMIAQMPIWIALYTALQTTFELRHAKFLWGFTWIDDLAKPDMLVAWSPVAIPLPLCGTVMFGSINLLPVILGLVYFWQFKTQPKPATMTPEQEQQQKIMQWMMPLLLPLVLYNGPSGLNLYIITSAVLGIIESQRIRAHLKAKEEQEAHLKLVDDKDLPRAEPARKGRLLSWIERLQQMAEQAKQQQQGRPGAGGAGRRRR